MNTKTAPFRASHNQLIGLSQSYTLQVFPSKIHGFAALFFCFILLITSGFLLWYAHELTTLDPDSIAVGESLLMLVLWASGIPMALFVLIWLIRLFLLYSKKQPTLSFDKAGITDYHYTDSTFIKWSQIERIERIRHKKLVLKLTLKKESTKDFPLPVQKKLKHFWSTESYLKYDSYLIGGPSLKTLVFTLNELQERFSQTSSIE